MEKEWELEVGVEEWGGGWGGRGLWGMGWKRTLEDGVEECSRDWDGKGLRTRGWIGRGLCRLE